MAENLKNTLLIEDTEYNINAVRSETAGTADKTQASLTLTKSLTTGDDKSQTFNGNVNQEIKYVPADLGGKFSGPVFIDNKYANLKDVPDQAIINYGQITSKIADLDGAPLYTLDADYQIHALTDANKVDYKLNTVVGTARGLKAFKSILANPNGSEGIKYDTLLANYSTLAVVGLYDTFNTDVVIPAKYTGTASNGGTKTWTINKISENAFSGKTSIKSVILPSSIEDIGKNAFNGCSTLVSINIPTNVKSIKTSTFSGCTSLESIIIPEGVTSIQAGAFSGCAKLASVVIPKSVGTGGGSLGEQIFDAEPNEDIGSVVDLTIYYTGTETEWNTLLTKYGSLTNKRIENAIDNNRVIYNYKVSSDIPSAGDLVDFKEFSDNPIIYICKDIETANSPVSNKMFLRLPGSIEFVEISKGAARLESPTEATTQGYYTYETLAAIIAGINSRLTALGSNTLALPSVLPETNDILIPNTIISEEILKVPEDICSVKDLNDEIDKIKNGPTTVAKAKADLAGRQINTGYYRSADEVLGTSIAGIVNTISIVDVIPTNPNDGQIGDIRIVISNKQGV